MKNEVFLQNIEITLTAPPPPTHSPAKKATNKSNDNIMRNETLNMRTLEITIFSCSSRSSFTFLMLQTVFTKNINIIAYLRTCFSSKLHFRIPSIWLMDCSVPK